MSKIQKVRVGIVGGGPVGLFTAIALANSKTVDFDITVYENAPSSRKSPTYDTQRSYVIDMTGHGLKAIQTVDGLEKRFDNELPKYVGVNFAFGPLFWKQKHKQNKETWSGSRGDWVRCFEGEIMDKYSDKITLNFERQVKHVDINNGIIKSKTSKDEGYWVDQSHDFSDTFDYIIGSDGSGSGLFGTSKWITEQDSNFKTLYKHKEHAWCSVIELDNTKTMKEVDKKWLNIFSVVEPRAVCGSVIESDDKDKSKPRVMAFLGWKNQKTFKNADECENFLKAKTKDT
eukprot:UN24801